MPQSKKQRLAAELTAPVAALHTHPDTSSYIGRIRPALPEPNNPSNITPVAAKRPQLSAIEKLEVLDWYHANGRNQKATAAHFQQRLRYGKLNQGTVSRWVAAEAKIRAAANGCAKSATCDGVHATREKSLKHPELEKCLALWLEQLDATRRARLTGREIKRTARQIYDELGVPEADRLELSNGWLGRFQTRHGLKLHRRSSEAISTDGAGLEEERGRIREEIATFLAGSDGGGSRSLEDVWTMETTSIFLECSPVKVAGDAEKYGKRTRIMAGLAVNATGAERLEPIFVGYDDSSQEGLKYYFSSRTARMNHSIFCEWLAAWDHALVGANRQVLLLVSEAYGNVADKARLSNIQLRFFPRTLPAHLQPCSVGLSKAFHVLYRKLLLNRVLSKLRGVEENDSTLFGVTPVDAMDLARSAWQQTGLEPKLAASCWQKTQILPAPAGASDVSTALLEADAYTSIAVNEEVVKLEQALQVLTLEAQSRHVSLNCMSADEFVALGLDEGESNDISIKELVQLVVRGQANTPAREESRAPTTLPTTAPSHADASPDLVLHAQLTLEQYWSQHNFELSPAIAQVLQQTRAHLQHASAHASSTPSGG
jgi:hypothetical protein